MRILPIHNDNSIDFVITTCAMQLIAYAHLKISNNNFLVAEMVSRPGFGKMLCRAMGMLASQRRRHVIVDDVNDASRNVLSAVCEEAESKMFNKCEKTISHFAYHVEPSLFYINSLNRGLMLVPNANGFVQQGQEWFLDSYMGEGTAWLDEVDPLFDATQLVQSAHGIQKLA
tara:strand:- start:14299 stop:14814 length:516 start_codon:yes stop_codon:yes gene_type:complete